LYTALKSTEPYRSNRIGKLIFGPVSQNHFKLSSDGWSCRWQSDREDTFFQLEYDRQRGQIVMNDHWHGIDGGFTVCLSKGDLMRAIAQVRYSLFPWDDVAINKSLECYRIRHISHQDGFTISVGFPDGPASVLCIPLGIGDLRSFIISFETDREKQNFLFPSFGYLRRCVGVINYVTGLNPGWAEDPKKLLFKTLETTGFVPLTMPTLERGANGSSALTVQRLLYLAFINVPFAGLLTTIEWLSRLSWISKISEGDPSETPKNGIEFTPFIGPANLEFETPYATFWDETGCRRATWVMPENKEAAVGDLLKSVNMSIEDALEQARNAERIGLELLNKLKDGSNA
jgi:hypothetical protein